VRRRGRPRGLALAHVLVRAGVSCVVLERQVPDELRAWMKAGMIEHRTVAPLKAYGLADPIVERGTRVGTCEFRADGEAFVLDYAARCGGEGHYIYLQQRLVGDWSEQLIAAGGDLRFGVRATRRGFAGQMHRSPTMTLFMLECRVARGTPNGRATASGRSCRIGLQRPDATPAGGKGMNMAIQDVLSLFNAGSADGFSYGLRRARLDQILHDPQFAHWFARAYVGLDG
jgi:2-polyprenyl-6-methoxyphenol hydroxylase-like FAD-dependent oxidoreductase